jgi:hypothetical protein
MEIRTIELTYTEPVISKLRYENTYRVKRTNWLLNLILKLFVRLKWIDDNVWYEKTEYRSFETDDLMELIRRQRRNYIRMTGKEPKRIIVGRDQQLKLFAQNNPTFAAINLNREETMCIGMIVELNPLINGVVVTE